jgi:hypothetical protein
MMKKTITFTLVLASALSVEIANADFTVGTPTNLGPIVNSSSVDWGPSISADGLTLYFSSRRGGGFGKEDIYVTTRETTSDPWEEPVNLESPVNTLHWEQGPSISADGLTLFFSSAYRPDGSGGDDIYVTTRATTDDPWDTPVNLGPIVNSSSEEWTPSISADGLTLFFTSNRAGGEGGRDLWATTRETIHDEWRPPVNLGPAVNSPHIEITMSISHDGLLLFFGSNRPGGSGGHDLWVTRRPTTSGSWGTPVNLGPTVNSSREYDQTPSISADGSTLYFYSDRTGGLGGGDIYQARVIPIVDFDGDGIVNMKDFSKLAQYWGQNESSVDIGPMPWGDGIVDVRDLAVLADDWLEEEVEDPTFVAHWKLDETEGFIAHDSAGDHDGTLHGDPIWQPTSGIVNGALELDGIGDYVSTPFVVGAVDAPFDVFVWVKGGAPGQVILSQRGAPGVGWLATDPSDGSLITDYPGLLGRSLASQMVVTDGQWHRVGLVWDPPDRMLYIDDVEVTSDKHPLLGGSHAGLYIGAGATLDPGSFFSGLIDDVRIYERAVAP